MQDDTKGFEQAARASLAIGARQAAEMKQIRSRCEAGRYGLEFVNDVRKLVGLPEIQCGGMGDYELRIASN